MPKNGPDDEIEVNLQLTDKGIKGNLRARTLAIFQRWLGSAFAVSIAKNNRAAQREQVLGALEKRAMQEIGAQALETLRNNPAVVDGVLEELRLPSVTRRIENTSVVFEKALEHLRENPASDEETEAGPPEISPEVADRLEQYASGASSDEVRERWGRIVAAEIRQPGTFSLKVLRIIDELDHEIPAIFERFAESRLTSGFVPRVITGRLPYSDELALVDAGLIHAPGSSSTYQLQTYIQGTQNGADVWALFCGKNCITIPKDGEFTLAGKGAEQAIIAHKGKPAVPAYLLTSAGIAITSILPPVDVSLEYLRRVRVAVPTARLWQTGTGGKSWTEREPLALETGGAGAETSTKLG